MSARLWSPHEHGGAASASEQRVLSVSPSRTDAMARQALFEARMPMHTSTPIVSDLDGSDPHHARLHDDGADSSAHPPQPSLDRFASELSAMIEVAASTAEALNRRLHEVGEGEHRAAAASAQLQEQLRLGARMLKAFGSQIARVENTLAGHQAYEKQVLETQAKIEQCFAGIESCVDKTVESVAYRLAEQARVAIARFDEGIAARQQRLAEIDERMNECAQGINGICEMVEQVQASVEGATASNEQTLERLSIAAGEAKQLLAKHDQARSALAADLHGLREEAKNIERSSKASGQSLREAAAQGQHAENALRQRLVEAESVAREAARMNDTVIELKDLLARLGPWEKLLLSGTINDEGLPEPLARVAGEVKQQISQDMNWLSLTMRDVAERVSSLASVAPVSSAASAPEPPSAASPALPSVAPVAPEVQVNVKKPLRLRSHYTGS